MIKRSGFTLIEIFITIVFALIILSIIGGAVGVASNVGGNLTYGINGVTESRCVEGYKFIVDQQGNARQILDEFGKGSRCENPNAGKPGAFGRM